MTHSAGVCPAVDRLPPRALLPTSLEARDLYSATGTFA